MPSVGRSRQYVYALHCRIGLSWYCSGRTAWATFELRPSAPMTTRARADRHPPGLVVALDADDRPALADDLADGEALADLGAGLRRGLDEQVVEHGPPRRVRGRAPSARAWRAGERERAEVERVALDRRAARGDDGVEEPPPPQRGHARGVDQVRRLRVARERRPVDQQHPVALAGQQHRGRCAGAAGTDHDHVVVAHGRSRAIRSATERIREVP